MKRIHTITPERALQVLRDTFTDEQLSALGWWFEAGHLMAHEEDDGGASAHRTTIMDGFSKLQTLWKEHPALFPNESSARWFIRNHRQSLLDAQAILIHVGKTWVHLQRFTNVARREALAEAARPIAEELKRIEAGAAARRVSAIQWKAAKGPTR